MEDDITKTTPEQNEALVLEAFDTLINKRVYEAAARFWSESYIQHSAHIAARARRGHARSAGPCHRAISIDPSTRHKRDTKHSDRN
jgi:hypothetical protein